MFPIEMDEADGLQIAPRAWLTLQDAWHAVANAPAAPAVADHAAFEGSRPTEPGPPLASVEPPRVVPLTPWASLALRTGAVHRTRTH